MIISASYRTDIPAYYGEWFRRRMAEGFVRVRNPYGGQPATLPLDPAAVDGFVFWTRNLRPFLPALAEVAQAAFPFVVQFTITGYPRVLDAATPPARAAIAQLHELVARYGVGCAVWRYDPILITSLTPPAWHRSRFARLADALAGAVDEVVVSWAQIYRKTARNLTLAARAAEFAWSDPPADAKRVLLGELATLAVDRGMCLSLCGQQDLAVPGVVGEARCIDAERLGRVAGRPIAARLQPHRRCGCFASRDIGAYDSCAHGCVYCYAVTSRAAGKRAVQAHDPAALSLAPLRG
jgi:hypothetical protein